MGDVRGTRRARRGKTFAQASLFLFPTAPDFVQLPLVDDELSLTDPPANAPTPSDDPTEMHGREGCLEQRKGDHTQDLIPALKRMIMVLLLPQVPGQPANNMWTLPVQGGAKLQVRSDQPTVPPPASMGAMVPYFCQQCYRTGNSTSRESRPT